MGVTRLTRLFAVAVIASGAVASIASAAIISETYVESRTGGKNFAAYSDSGDAFPNSWANSTAKSSASGTTGGIGTRFNSNVGAGGTATWFQVSPTLPTAGGTYEVYATVPTGGPYTLLTAGVNIVSGGSGLPATTNAFSLAGNQWHLIGTLVLNSGVNNPTIRFYEHTHPTNTGNTSRFYADTIRFAEIGFPNIAVSHGVDPVGNGGLVDFGTEYEFATAQQTLTIQNTGNAPLNLGAMNFTGPFSVVGAPPVTIGAGGSANLTLAMDTTSKGPKAGTVSFTTDVSGVSPFTINLQGEVIPEPATFVLAGLGLAGVGFAARRRK